MKDKYDREILSETIVPSGIRYFDIERTISVGLDEYNDILILEIFNNNPPPKYQERIIE